MAYFFLLMIHHLKIYAMPRQTTQTKKKSAPAKKAATSRQTSGKTDSQSNSMLEEFVVDMLKDIYWAEKQLVKTLPKMQKAATTEALKEAMGTHLEQTREQVTRLEQAFEMMGKKVQAKKCEAMEGLIKEGQSVMEETEAGSMTRDVGLIVSAQKIEHYEIATYGSLVQLSRTIGNEEMADLLDMTLQEEKETDQLLTSIAENDINYQAEEEEEE